VELTAEPAPRISGRVLLLLWAAALSVRLAAAAYGGLDRSRFGDAPGDIRIAGTIVATGHFANPVGMYFRPPGYPLYLAVATLGHPESVARDKVVSAAASALAAPLLALLSARLFRRRTLALATGSAATVHPAFLVIGADVMTETTFLPLLLLAGLLLLAATDRPSTSLALTAGLCLALATLTRPSALALAPLLVSPLGDRRWPFRARAHLAGAAVLGFAFGLAPWTARNALVHRELIPVSDEGGASFFDGNSRWALRMYQLTDRKDTDSVVIAGHQDKVERLSSLDPSILASPTRRSLALVRFALEDLRADPAGARRLYLLKIWHWVRPYPTLFWGLPVVIGFGALYMTLYAFTAIGMARASRRGAVVCAVAVLVISMALHVTFLVLWRYRIPYVDPILLLFGLFGASDTLGRRWAPPS
jgi:4-amino-4-deoxy-L-arabinose transferase-like glycosyltransferase